MTTTPDQPTPDPTTPPEESLEITLPGDARTVKDISLWAGLLILLSLVVYWPTTEGKFLWQDDRHVSENNLLAAPGGLSKIWFSRWSEPKTYPLPSYQPAAFTVDWIAYRLGGRDAQNLPAPFAYHLANLLLHAGAVVLLWLTLRRLKVPGAWVAAAIFAVHPINAESVSWISQTGAVLAGLLFFASLYTYLLFIEQDELAKIPAATENEEVDPALQWGLYALSLIFFTLAMLSKSTAFIFPVVLLLVLWWQKKFSFRYLGLALPFIIIAVGLAMAAADFEQDTGAGSLHLSLMDRLPIAGTGIGFYILKLLVPFPLSAVYSKSILPPVWGVAVLVIALIMIPALLFIMVKKIGPGTLVGAIAFVGALFPLLGIFEYSTMRYSYVADHIAYLASAAFITLLVAMVATLLMKVTVEKTRNAIASSLAAVVLLGFGALAWSHAGAFADPLSFWKDTVAKNPGSAFVQASLADALRTVSVADVALGDEASVARSNDEMKEALDHAQQAVKIEPDHFLSQLVLGRVLLQSRKFQDSIEHLKAAADLDPRSAPAAQNLAEGYIRLGQHDTAIVALNRLLATQPADSLETSETHRLLGTAYGMRNEMDRAIAEDKIAINLKPDNTLARTHLAALLSREGKTAEAIMQLTFVAKLHPQDPEVWNALGKLFAKKNTVADMQYALQFFNSAIKLDPTYADAIKNRDMAETLLKSMNRPGATRPASQPATSPTAPKG